VVRATASSACLETARRADEMIHLLIRNRRDQAAELLVAYTVASRSAEGTQTHEPWALVGALLTTK
jgi:hypothetical protein